MKITVAWRKMPSCATGSFQSSHHERLPATKDENGSSATDSLIRPFADSLIFKARSSPASEMTKHATSRILADAWGFL
jgi:hypothetical protein